MSNTDIYCIVTVINRGEYNQMIAALEARSMKWKYTYNFNSSGVTPSFQPRLVNIETDALDQESYDIFVGKYQISFVIYADEQFRLTFDSSNNREILQEKPLELSVKEFVKHVEHKERYLYNLYYIYNKFATKSIISNEPDPVAHPEHYNFGSIETIKYIEDKLNPTEFRGYIKGNVLKYVSREAHKNGTEDLKKAHWYLSYLLEKLADNDSDDD